MQVTVLSSGSKGNCLWVESGGTAVLVEAGLSPRRLSQRMEKAGLAGRRPDALLVTHYHYDHVRCATEVATAFNIPTYCTQPTADDRVRAGVPLRAHRPLDPRGTFRVGSLRITAFPTPHDAEGSVGLVLDDGSVATGIVTDLGCVTHTVVDALKDCSLLYAEFNHDVQMLMDGPYPANLKRRCRSNVGHLSNEQGAELVERARGPLLRTLVLAHLSETNNTPELALFAARRSVDGADVDIRIAHQSLVLGPIDVRGNGPRPAWSVPARPERVVPVSPASAPPAWPATAPAVVTVGRGRATSRRPGPGPSAQLSLFN